MVVTYSGLTRVGPLNSLYGEADSSIEVWRVRVYGVVIYNGDVCLDALTHVLLPIGVLSIRVSNGPRFIEGETVMYVNLLYEDSFQAEIISVVVLLKKRHGDENGSIIN